MADPAGGGARVGSRSAELLGTSEFAVCVATFYAELAERLANGAVEGFADGGVAPTSVHAYEVPGGVRAAAGGPLVRRVRPVRRGSPASGR